MGGRRGSTSPAQSRFGRESERSDTLASVTNYDIIGDVHGQIHKLTNLLKHLGYLEIDGAYRREGHLAIFVGDLIDRGSGQLEVLQTVKAMIDAGSALCVMGNHEFNALAYSTLKDPKGPDGKNDFCRPHIAKNRHQHEAFLGLDSHLRAEWLQWFRTLPLWLDLDELRIVHACWHEQSMKDILQAFGEPFIRTDDQIRLATNGKSLAYQAIETLLKGPELNLESLGIPSFEDKSGHSHNNARISWWLGDDKPDWLLQGPDLQKLGQDKMNTIIEAIEPFRYHDTLKALFFGHYWQTSKHELALVTIGPNAACVDFSAGEAGELTAYRYRSGEQITPAGYLRESQAF